MRKSSTSSVSNGIRTPNRCSISTTRVTRPSESSSPLSISVRRRAQATSMPSASRKIAEDGLHRVGHRVLRLRCVRRGLPSARPGVRTAAAARRRRPPRPGPHGTQRSAAATRTPPSALGRTPFPARRRPRSAAGLGRGDRELAVRRRAAREGPRRRERPVVAGADEVGDRLRRAVPAQATALRRPGAEPAPAREVLRVGGDRLARARPARAAARAARRPRRTHWVISSSAVSVRRSRTAR